MNSFATDLAQTDCRACHGLLGSWPSTVVVTASHSRHSCQRQQARADEHPLRHYPVPQHRSQFVPPCHVMSSCHVSGTRVPRAAACGQPSSQSLQAAAASSERGASQLTNQRVVVQQQHSMALAFQSVQALQSVHAPGAQAALGNLNASSAQMVSITEHL